MQVNVVDDGEIAAEQGEEVTTGRNHRPPNSSLFTVAQEDIAYPLPHLDDSQMLGDPSMSIGLQYAPPPTPLVPSQLDQQAANHLENMHIQETHLSEEVQRQLAEVEWQHEVARYQILEKAQAVPASQHLQDATDSHPYTTMDWTATGYTGADDYTNMPANPSQIPNHGLISTDNMTAHGIDANFWPSQQLPQPTVYLNAFQNHFQDVSQQNDTFLAVQDLDYNAFGHSAYSQQPAFHPVMFETSQYHTMPSVLGSHDQGNYYDLSMAAPRPPCIQLSLPLYDVRSSPASRGEFPTCQTNRPLHGSTTPHQGPSWDSHTPLVPGQSLDVTIPAIDHSDTISLHVPETLEPQLPAISRRGQIKRGKRKERSSKSTGAERTSAAYALDNIYFHSNPSADRQRRRLEPRRRHVTEKATRSCYGCRFNKRKCDLDARGICLRCQNILKTYSWRTAIPKFTCDVRTKFSEMLIFADIPPENSSADSGLSPKLLCGRSSPMKIDLDDGFGPVTIERSTVPFSKAGFYIMLRLLWRVRNLLDVLEPLHFRQYDTKGSDPMTVWSYSFSMVKWKDAIRFFWPELGDVVEFHTNFHRDAFRMFLSSLDYVSTSKPDISWIITLNYWYEGISNMDDTPLVNTAAKNHLLDSLTHYILHLYRRMFPTTPLRNDTRRLDDWEDVVRVYNFFPLTSKLLPAKYRSLPRISIAIMMIREHGEQLISPATMIASTASAFSTESLKQMKRPSPRNAYVSKKIASIFRLSAAQLDNFEGVVQDDLLENPTYPQEPVFGLSTWTLSIALRAYFENFEILPYTDERNAAILVFIIYSSLRVWHYFKDFYLQSDPSDHPKSFGDLIMTDRDTLETRLVEWLAEDKTARSPESYIPKRSPKKLPQ